MKFGGTYRMYYTGHDGNRWTDIGLATSTDGITWTKYAGNPIVRRGTSSAWDSFQAFGPSVVFDGFTWYMFYQGNNAIGLATSSDGISFTKSSANPVLIPASGWESTSLDGPNVILEGGTFTMWYGAHEGSTYRIGRATSNDGMNWTRDPANPVLNTGIGWESAGVYNPSVIRVGRMYYMFYAGHDGQTRRVGLATSWDGSIWTKAASNPIWSAAPEPYTTLDPGALLVDGDRLWNWFNGTNGAGISIGAAAMDLQ